MPGLPGIIVGRNDYISWGVVTLGTTGSPFFIHSYLFLLESSELFVEELSKD